MATSQRSHRLPPTNPNGPEKNSSNTRRRPPTNTNLLSSTLKSVPTHLPPYQARRISTDSSPSGTLRSYYRLSQHLSAMIPWPAGQPPPGAKALELTSVSPHARPPPPARHPALPNATAAPHPQGTGTVPAPPSEATDPDLRPGHPLAPTPPSARQGCQRVNSRITRTRFPRLRV